MKRLRTARMSVAARPPLPAAFFDRPADAVARGLVGATLVRRRRGRTLRWRIREVEAYLAGGDRASHAFRGPTRRNAPMFGPPGRWYVYRVYGLHWLLNVVTGPGRAPSAVLLRVAGPATGPAAVCARLGIDWRWSGRPLGRRGGLWIERRTRAPRLEALPRVGVRYAGPRWSGRRLRFREVAAARPDA